MQKICRKNCEAGFLDRKPSNSPVLSVPVGANGFLGSSNQFDRDFNAVGHLYSGCANVGLGTKGRGTNAL